MIVHLVGLIYGSNFSFSNTNILDMVIKVRTQTLSENYETEKVIPRTERNVKEQKRSLETR
jgi:hypothetical protein